MRARFGWPLAPPARRVRFGDARSVDQSARVTDQQTDSLPGRRRAEAPPLYPRVRREGPVEAIRAGMLQGRPFRLQTNPEQASRFQRSWLWNDYSWLSPGSKRA